MVEEVKGSTILLTGATGFIGHLAACRILEKWTACQLILPVRDLDKAQKMYAAIQIGRRCEPYFVESNVEELDCGKIPMPVDYIIHCAAPTSSGYMISHPAETADSVVLGTRNMLELAKDLRIKSMVHLSSMEVYGQVDDIGRPRREDELGDIDLKNPRSCYPLGKRMAEHYCHIYQQEYGVPVKIARMAQVFGRGVRLDDQRVFMQFAQAAYRGEDIVLHTAGLSMGNYCDADDAVDAIFTLLQRGRDGEVYNVVNEENTMRIKDMAELVAEKIAGKRIRVHIEPDARYAAQYAPATALRLSSAKLRKLAWQPAAGLEQMYQNVLDEIKTAESESLRECK